MATGATWSDVPCTMRTGAFNDGRWHQVVFVVDTAGGALYVDGALKASQPWTGTPGPPTTPSWR